MHLTIIYEINILQNSRKSDVDSKTQLVHFIHSLHALSFAYAYLGMLFRIQCIETDVFFTVQAGNSYFVKTVQLMQVALSLGFMMTSK